MKHFFAFMVIFYQKFISVILKNIIGVNGVCRYSPSCSEYTKKAILKFGILKGGYKGFIRIISCQPLIKIN